jgi:farnesyl-diphosphate farnesyltransferase
VAFGEGLQLVNILKDSSDDARDGRVYLPQLVERSDILALARTDLEQAGEYIFALQRGGAPRGFLAFTGTSLVLADASLERLKAEGPGAKVSRADVARLVGALERDLEGGRLELVRRARA